MDVKWGEQNKTKTRMIDCVNCAKLETPLLLIHLSFFLFLEFLFFVFFNYEFSYFSVGGEGGCSLLTKRFELLCRCYSLSLSLSLSLSVMQDPISVQRVYSPCVLAICIASRCDASLFPRVSWVHESSPRAGVELCVYVYCARSVKCSSPNNNPSLIVVDLYRSAFHPFQVYPRKRK